MKRPLSRQLKNNTDDITDTFTVNSGKHILSMGAGVQTTALLIKFGTKYDHVIFADTGDEQPETYYYIENYLKPFCQEKGINWLTVKNKKYDSLMDHCIKEKWTPNIQRLLSQRRCTNHFKIQPINHKIRELGATRKAPYNVHIGISIDEAHRLGSGAWINKPQYQHKVYPLIDAKLSRKDCHQIIKDAGMPPPVKSGCDFCPFAGRKRIRSIAGRDSERFKKIIELDNCDNKGRHLFDAPLTLSHTLTEFNEDEEQSMCESGHCFT